MTADRRDLLPLILIAVIAAGLRFGRADIVEYFHDDAMLATLALDLAGGSRLPTTGILSSTGIPNAPISVYILAFPFTVSSDPHFAIHFVMFINVLGVGLLWLLARRYFGAVVAFCAGMAYAVNPWAILFSRKLWAQELHTPFVLFAILLLLHGFWRRQTTGPRRSSVVLAQCLGPPIFLASVQVHFAALALLPMLPLILWRGRRNINRPALLLALTFSALVMAPYALGLGQTLTDDPYRIADALARSSDRGIRFSLDSLSALLGLTSGSGLESWLAPDNPARLASQLSPLSHVNLLLLPLLAIGMRAAYERSSAVVTLLLSWALFPFLLLLFEWTPVYVHYFIASLPALMLLIALGVERLLLALSDRRWARIALVAMLSVIFGAQALQWQMTLEYVAERHIAYPGFTTPLSVLLPLRDRLRQADDVVVVGGGMSWNLHHEVAVWDTLLGDDVNCVRTIVADGYAVLPSHAFTIAVAPEAGTSPIDGFYDNARVERYPTRAGGLDFLVYSWDSAPNWSGAAIEAIEPRRFDNGVSLTGYGFGDGKVLLEWQLPAPQIGADYQYSAQLFTSAGDRIAQQDATFWHGRHWCDGDRLLTWLPLEIDHRASTLKVAMYKLGQGSERGLYFPANALDAMGNPAGRSADISLR